MKIAKKKLRFIADVGEGDAAVAEVGHQDGGADDDGWHAVRHDEVQPRPFAFLLVKDVDHQMAETQSFHRHPHERHQQRQVQHDAEHGARYLKHFIF